MRKPSFTVLLALTLTLAMGTAHAEEKGWPHPVGGPEDRPLPGVLDTGNAPSELPPPCNQLNLTKDQKTKLKEAYFKFKEKKIDLESKVQKAHLQYEKLMSDPASDFDSAEGASRDIIAAATEMMKAHSSYENEINFSILKAEQRQPARACQMMMMHHAEHEGLGKGEGKHDYHVLPLHSPAEKPAESR